MPGAIVGAVGFEVLKVVGGDLRARAVASSSALYGSIGVVFAILAWLLFFGRLRRLRRRAQRRALGGGARHRHHRDRGAEPPRRGADGVTRAGEMEPKPDVSVSERLT